MSVQTPNVIAEVKRAYNIVDLIQEYNVQLTQKGRIHYGICPFHSDTSPSLQVDEVNQKYTCFVCKSSGHPAASGDIFKFTMEKESLSFSEALHHLAERKGIKIKALSNEEKEKAEITSKLYTLLKDADDFFKSEFNKLNENHLAIKEITKRKLKINKAVYGYAPERRDGLYKFLKEKGYSDKIIEESKLVTFKEGMPPFDFFQKRLLFTFYNFMGKPITFTSRKIFESDTLAKYVNGRDSQLFSKKKALYNINDAKNDIRKNNRVFLVEGQFDVEALKQIEHNEVLAISGTAFTTHHANEIIRLLNANGQIIIVLDGDTAGTKAAMKIYKEIPIIHNMTTIVELKEGYDPSDYIQNGIEDELENKLTKGIDFTTFIFNKIKSEHDFSSHSARQRFIVSVAEYINCIKDEGLKESWVRKIATVSSVPALEVNKILKEVAKNVFVPKPPPEKLKTHEIPTFLEDKENRVEIDKNSHADKNYISAFALLIRDPRLLLKHTSKNVDKKFIPFLKEVQAHTKEYIKKNETFKFIEEDYTCISLCKIIARKTFIEIPENDEDMILDYKALMKAGDEAKQRELEATKRAEQMKNYENATSVQELIELMKLAK